MTRCLTLLTLSFLATTTLVEAGKNFDFLNDFNNLEKLEAKSTKLVQSIESTQDPELKQALEQKLKIITTRCVQNPLPQLSNEEAGYWFEVQDRVSQAKSAFLKAREATFIADPNQRKKAIEYLEDIERQVYGIWNLRIYEEDSKEHHILKSASETLDELKRSQNEKELAYFYSQFIEQEEKLLRILREVEEMKKAALQDFRAMKKNSSTLIRDVEMALEAFPYEHKNCYILNEAYGFLRSLNSEYYYENETESAFRYRSLKKELDNALEEYGDLKRKGNSLISAMLMGRYTELRQRLESAFKNQDVDRNVKNDIGELLDTMRGLDRIISLTTRYLELEPKVLPFLPADETLGDTLGIPPKYTPTTFVSNQFGPFITPAFNVPSFPVIGGGAPQYQREDGNPDLDALFASFGIKTLLEPMVVQAPRFTYRTTGANPNARSEQSATSIKLSNREMQDAAYQLIVTHRTRGRGPMVRIFNPNIRKYINLGTLPSSVDFSDTPFDLTSWAKAVRHDSALGSGIETYVSFVGESDIHSFAIRSDEKTLKEVIFGDKESESQSGVHVYAPETDGDANEWSEAREDDGE